MGAPEVFTLLAGAVLGKENFTCIKLRVLGKLEALKPAPASRGQYYVGLCVMLLPIIPTYIMAYAPSPALRAGCVGATWPGRWQRGPPNTGQKGNGGRCCKTP